GKTDVLLKGASFAEYRDGEWVAEKPSTTLESKNGLPIAVRDPSLDGPARAPRGSWDEWVEHVSLQTKRLYAAGPVVWVDKSVGKIEVDREGSLRLATNTYAGGYHLLVSAPNDAVNLKERTIAEHPDVQRYVRQLGLSPAERDSVEARMRQIVRSTLDHP